MQRSRKIKDVKMNIHAETKKVIQHEVGDSIQTVGIAKGEVGFSRQNLTESEKGKSEKRLFRVRDLTELRKAASGSAT